MSIQYRIAAAALVALSIYGGSGLAGPHWAPIGGSDLAQTGTVFGAAFILSEVAEALIRFFRDRD